MEKIDIAGYEFNQNAHDMFKQWRQEQPVVQTKMTFQKPYLILRYDDVAAALKSDWLVKNPRGQKSMFWMPPAFRAFTNNMLNNDEPNHRRLRTLVHKAFTPRMIRQLDGRIETIANDLLDKAIPQGEVDLITAYALPLPITVISDMLGVPETDRAYFGGLAGQILTTPTPLNMVKLIPTMRRISKYVRQLAAKRRREPQDDLISALALAEDEGDMLSEDELIGMIVLLLIAGYETTVSLIANGTLALLQHREQLAQLRADMGLLESAIEEILRYDSPLHTTEMGFAGEDVTLHGVTIPKGGLVLPVLSSANRDEAMFDAPDRFDITRTPNKHLAFGHGIHYCLGAPLARIEAKIAFETLLNRAPHLRLTTPNKRIERKAVMIVNRLEALPVTF